MKYLKINALLIELWDEYKPESIPIMLKENNLQGEWQLLSFDDLSSEDKVRALNIRLKDTEKQLGEWRELTLRARAARNKVPTGILRQFGDAYRLIIQS